MEMKDDPRYKASAEEFRKELIRLGVEESVAKTVIEDTIPQMIETVFDKMVTFETIGAIFLMALIKKGYSPRYGSYAGRKNVAMIIDPYAKLPQEFSSAVMMELDEWFHKSSEESLRRQ
jgi:hypothetical protein